MNIAEIGKEIIRDFNWNDSERDNMRACAYQIFRNPRTGCLYLKCANRMEGGVDDIWEVAEKELPRLLEAHDNGRMNEYLEQFVDEMWWEHTIGYTQG